jgi:hypothetical protein
VAGENTLPYTTGGRLPPVTTSTLTLANFLLARIAEDEALLGDGPYSSLRLAAQENAERWRAECEAKRRIVELAWHHFGEDDYAWGMEHAKGEVLKLLAVPYADHPDYRDEWRP